MQKDIYRILEDAYKKYAVKSFIENDPISIPHRFSKKEDIEISAFLSSSISWGQRNTIVKNANRIISLMDYSPYDFTINQSSSELKTFEKFVHRTFNSTDLIYFINSLKNIYINYGGLENLFTTAKDKDLKRKIAEFHSVFFELPAQSRSKRHISDINKNSAAKRLNMFLRWMVRKDKVDIGIWKKIKPSELFCPLDLHSANVARCLGLLHRNANDWKAVEELTSNLQNFDKKDPVKYDIALFGLGIYKGLN